MTDCDHADVHIHVNHHRSGDTNVQYLEITAQCNLCAKPMTFRGMPMGSSPDQPMASPDGREARLPMVGEGERVTGNPAGFRISIDKGSLQ
jgi:hypothetical protein